ncbi:MAG: monofunctional biosynthetic peptidoglycan transglycosylase [Deltaproteobacteria bacterium]|nr:MAG: monofunctional biosynthetic peptidoglycan transglycosylase [Deltaproteobacteria bacterium]
MKYLKRTVAGVLLLTVIPILVLRWVEPPTSAFMLQKRFKAWWNKDNGFKIQYRWVNWERISPHAPLAVVAAEDQKFPIHWGFDREAITDAWQERVEGIRVRGASTISQQVAKNLFLWPAKSFIRKGIEAYFTVLIEILWPKQRILEVYLNIAEFGNGVFGVAAASRTFFEKSPRRLTREECALMAAVLPSPSRLHLDQPSSYVLRRSDWILEEMDRLDRISNQPYLYNL